MIRRLLFVRRLFLCLFSFGQQIHYFIHSVNEKNYNAYNYKNAQHSLPHILEREQKTVYAEIFKNIHIHFLPSSAQKSAEARGKAEYKSARDNGSNLTRNVDAD